MKHGWTSIQQENEEKRKNQNEDKKIIRALIKSTHYSVLKEKPRDLQTYMHLMYERGIEVKPYINKQGNIQRYRFVHLFSGTDLKASEVDRNLKLNELFLPRSGSMVSSGGSTESSSQYALSSFRIGKRIYL